LAELNIDFFERFCLKNDSYKKKNLTLRLVYGVVTTLCYTLTQFVFTECQTLSI
jgi:hypothetical protein